MALALGILGVTSCTCLTGIPAIVLGMRAQRRIDASGGIEGGRTMATTAVVLGWVSTALGLVAALTMAVAIWLAVALDGGDRGPAPPPVTTTVSVPR